MTRNVIFKGLDLQTNVFPSPMVPTYGAGRDCGGMVLVFIGLRPKKRGVVMKAQALPYHAKRTRPIIDWDWMRFDDEVESVDVEVLGTVAAGELIEAVPYHQKISIPKNMVGRFEAYALRVEGHSMVDDNIQHGDYIIIHM